MSKQIGFTKAEFKALREVLGYSHALLAKQLDVASRTVKRWEDPTIEGSEPPLDKCEALAGIAHDQDKRLAALLYGMEGGTEAHLHVYRDKEQYVAEHTNADPDAWMVHNAFARRVFAEALRHGYADLCHLEFR